MKVRVLVAAVAGAAIIFALGYLIYGMLLVSYMRDNTIQYSGLNKEPPDFVPFLFSNLFLLFCWRLFSSAGRTSEPLPEV